MTLWCERRLQGARNSGRVVARMSSGACAPRSASGLHQVERGRVGPVQILEGERDRLRSRPGQNPGGHRRQLPGGAIPPAQISRRVPPAAGCRPAARAAAHIRRGRGRSAASVFSRSASRRSARLIRAEALTAPFGDRVQRRILQELRRRPFDPGVRRLAERRAELLDEPRLADAGLADDQYELALAIARPLPAPAQQRRVPPPGRREGVSVRAPPLRRPPLARTMR